MFFRPLDWVNFPKSRIEYSKILSLCLLNFFPGSAIPSLVVSGPTSSLLSDNPQCSRDSPLVRVGQFRLLMMSAYFPLLQAAKTRPNAFSTPRAPRAHAGTGKLPQNPNRIIFKQQSRTGRGRIENFRKYASDVHRNPSPITSKRLINFSDPLGLKPSLLPLEPGAWRRAQRELL